MSMESLLCSVSCTLLVHAVCSCMLSTHTLQRAGSFEACLLSTVRIVNSLYGPAAVISHKESDAVRGIFEGPVAGSFHSHFTNCRKAKPVSANWSFPFFGIALQVVTQPELSTQGIPR